MICKNASDVTIDNKTSLHNTKWFFLVYKYGFCFIFVSRRTSCNELIILSGAKNTPLLLIDNGCSRHLQTDPIILKCFVKMLPQNIHKSNHISWSSKSVVDNYMPFARPLLRYLEILQLEENKVVCCIRSCLLRDSSIYRFYGTLDYDCRRRKYLGSRVISYQAFFVELKH